MGDTDENDEGEGRQKHTASQVQLKEVHCEIYRIDPKLPNVNADAAAKWITRGFNLGSMESIYSHKFDPDSSVLRVTSQLTSS